LSLIEEQLTLKKDFGNDNRIPGLCEFACVSGGKSFGSIKTKRTAHIWQADGSMMATVKPVIRIEFRSEWRLFSCRRRMLFSEGRRIRLLWREHQNLQMAVSQKNYPIDNILWRAMGQTQNQTAKYRSKATVF